MRFSSLLFCKSQNLQNVKFAGQNFAFFPKFEPGKTDVQKAFCTAFYSVQNLAKTLYT